MQTTLSFSGGKAPPRSSKPSSSSSKGGSKPYTKINKATDASKAKGRERSFDRQSLKDHNDIITQSTAYERAFHYVSGASGHQQSNGRSSTVVSSWNQHRNAKLSFQAARAETGIFKRVVCYLNGFQGEEEGNLNIRRLVQLGGGKLVTMYSKSIVTHIVTDTGLSGSKIQQLIEDKRSKVRVVSPQWVIDSHNAGHRKPEHNYAVLEHETQKSARVALGVNSSNQLNTASSSVANEAPNATDKQAMEDWAWLEMRERRKQQKAEEAEASKLTSGQRPRPK